jgi:tetratricopeptide (TPR) repeat protein
MQRLVLLFALCACAMLARGDTIEMKPESPDPEAQGLKLEGKIERELPDAIVFLVYNQTGQILIPKSKIKNIEYDINTQLEKIAEDDYAGRYKVAVWAVEKGKFPEAIKLFEDLKAKAAEGISQAAQGVGRDMLKLLGHCYEQRQQTDKAVQNYKDYLRLNPDDADVTARVERLRKDLPPEPGAEPGPATKTVEIKAKVHDGLEGDGVWIVENWGNPGVVQFTSDQDTGNKMIVVQDNGGEKDKAAVSRTGQPLNLADSKEMVCKISHNSPTPLNVAFAFVNDQGEFHETKEHRVAANIWVPISLKIDGRIFKANRNNFKDFDLQLEGRERIKRILFLVYTQKPFTMYVDGIYFK